jgi:uncharacterized membrane protein
MIDLYHIHPMLVHFPIVLFLLGAAVQFIALARRTDLSGRSCFANATLALFVLAAIAAAVTAFFGDEAFDHAVSLGFPQAPLDHHAILGYITMWFFIVYAAFYLFAWWRQVRLAGGRGWLLFIASLVGVALVLVTAYFGGDLVYRIGVNVAPVTP